MLDIGIKVVKTMASFIRKTFFSSSIVLIATMVFADSSYFELERTIAHSLRAELRPQLERFLLNRLGHPDHPYQLSTAVQVESGSIQAVNVKVVLSFDSSDAGLDVDLKRALNKYFTSKGYRTSIGLWGARKPLAKVEVGFDSAHASGGLVGWAAKLIFAVFCLMVIRNLYRQRRIRSSGNINGSPERMDGSEVSENFPKYHPDIGGMGLSLRQMDEKGLQINPIEGTWYLNSLGDMSSSHLDGAFRSLPMNEAVILLKNFPVPYRNQLISKLNLRSPVKQQLKSVCDHDNT